MEKEKKEAQKFMAIMFRDDGMTEETFADMNSQDIKAIRSTFIFKCWVISQNVFALVDSLREYFNGIIKKL
jgi:hypothetical protein